MRAMLGHRWSATADYNQGMKLSEQLDKQRDAQNDRRVGPIVDRVINWGLIIGAVVVVLFLLGTVFGWIADWYFKSGFTNIPK